MHVVAQNLRLSLELLLWAVGRRKRYVVDGASMVPLLKSGDHLLARTVGPEEHLQEGQLVVALHPERSLILVKRVGSVRADALWLVSDNPAGTDSTSFGWVGRQRVLGIVTCHAGRGRPPRLC